MSNQRSGKWKPAALSDGASEMRLRDFFRHCMEATAANGDEDSSFYFEQIVDHLNAGRSLPSNRRDIENLLGL